MTRKPKKPYTGVLDEPLPPSATPADYLERVMALGEHYGVEVVGPNAEPLTLALKLAHDHVQGFQFKKPGPSIRGLADGRKPDVTKDIVILAALGRADMADENVSKAARHLASTHPDWAMGAEAIRQRYLSMKSKKNASGRRRLLRVVDTLALIDRHSKKAVGK